MTGSRSRSLLLVTALLACAPAALGIEPFHVELERQAAAELAAGQAAAAARHFAVACFGMLDDPPARGRCLARLAIAQATAEDRRGFVATFERLAEVELRFSGYTRAAVDPALRSELGRHAAAWVPAERLEAVPVFRALVREAAAVDGAESRAVAEASAAPSEPAAAEPVTPPQPGGLSAADAAELARAREGLRSTSRSVLEAAFARASEVADRNRQSAATQHLAAELAYRLTRWADAVAYFRRGGEVDDARPELLFYLAVSLYETGDHAAAATTLEAALPRMARTEFVQGYARKILGDGAVR